MDKRKLLGTGIFGAAVMAVCCFTPALLILLGAVGLSAWLAWLDYLLIPGLILFIGLTAVALLLWQRERQLPDARAVPEE